ncbi:Cullin repeat-like-containing domain protein [Hyaloraphidium curvatum]|nr:Cullin repeat-like-containing domain protein [Hyaloraphidium curvatum]
MEMDRRPRTRAEVQAQLVASETREIEDLEESLKKIDGLKDRMVSMLDSFDGRLKKMEGTILPVHRSTQKLTRMADNLDKVLMLLNNVNVYLELPRQEEAIIMKGPAPDKVDEYLVSLDRVRQAARYITKTQLRSADDTLRQLNKLIATGFSKLEDLFREVLSSYSNPFDITPYINAPIPSLPQQILEFLLALSNNLIAAAEYDSNEHLLAYVGVRAPYLQKCLDGPMARAESDRVSKEGYAKGTGGAVAAGKALLRMMKAEYVLAYSILPTHTPFPAQALSQSVHPSATLFLSTANSLYSRARRSLSRAEFADSLVALDLLDTAAALLREPGERIADAVGESGGAGQEVWEALSGAALAAGTFLRRFYLEVKTENNEKGIPSDGTVSELTSQTVSVLRRLLEYLPTVELLLTVFPDLYLRTSDPTADAGTKQKVAAALCDPSPPPSQGGTRAGRFFDDVVDALLLNIQSKSRTYKRPGLSAVFLMNNHHFILRQLRASMLGVVRPETEGKCDKGLAKFRDAYLDSWKPLLEHLMDVTYVQGGKIQGQLSKPQRDAVKEKFRAFNADFDAALASAGSVSVPDPELRASLVKEVRGLLVPLYARFYDRYQAIEFTKNPEKYVRWDKAALEKAVAGLWDGSAV